jgi:hypothetical protein
MHVKENNDENAFIVSFFTNSYPQEREAGQQPAYINVWKKGHRGSDP